MISPKKRFDILKRDSFRCKYCWKNWKDVTLEVDHIIPKSQWWKDTMDNLICCCRECNQWKWSDWIDQSHDKNLYKRKVNDTIYKLITYFYDKRNENELWTIWDKEKVLIRMYCTDCIKWDDWKRYLADLNCPRLHPDWFDWQNADIKKLIILFKNWWEFCDVVLEFLSGSNMIDGIIEEIKDDGSRSRDTSDWPDYSWKLNYKLTYFLADYWNKIRPYTLYPKLLKNA